MINKVKNKKNQFSLYLMLITGLFVFGTGIMAHAHGTWANAQTFTVNANTVWNGVNTQGNRLGNTKRTENANFDVHTVSKTMLSTPRVRLVNSNGAIRGGGNNGIATAAAGRTVVGSQTGVVGFAYFIQVNPAWNQVTNNQSIRLQHRSR